MVMFYFSCAEVLVFSAQIPPSEWPWRCTLRTEWFWNLPRFSFLALHWLPQLSCPPQECDWMQRRHQSWICHKMCLQTMAKDRVLTQNLLKTGWCSPATSLKWVNSPLVAWIHPWPWLFLICKVMVHIIWELNCCIPSAEYLYLLWKSVSE